MLYVKLQNLQKKSNPAFSSATVLPHRERCGATFCSVSAVLRKDCERGEGILDCLRDDIMGFQLLNPIKNCHGPT